MRNAIRTLVGLGSLVVCGCVGTSPTQKPAAATVDHGDSDATRTPHVLENKICTDDSPVFFERVEFGVASLKGGDFSESSHRHLTLFLDDEKDAVHRFEVCRSPARE